MRKLSEEQIRYVEGNKHIIKFEGFRIFVEDGYEKVDYNNQNILPLIDTYYHEEMEWIKPVIGLIKKKGFKANLIGHHCTITADASTGLRFRSPLYIDRNSEVESLWRPVVEFCIWYNERQPE
jgi:hypothetical protein